MTLAMRHWLSLLGLSASLCACPAKDDGPRDGGSAQEPSSAGHAQAASAGKAAAAGAGAGAGAGKSAGGSGDRSQGWPAAGSTSAGSTGGAGSTGHGGSHAGPDADGGVDLPTADGGSKPAACDAQCAAGEHCELVTVVCVRAPCPPQPKCVVDGQAGASCGSRGQAACPDDQFCDFPRDSNCGATDQPGICKPRPQACTDQYDPVCGCDGATYGNACNAAGAGVSVAKAGECQSSAPTGTLDCDPSKILCRRAPPKCAAGQVPSVNGSCYGDCVRPEACACSAPEQCPLPDQYTCFMSRKHCTPFL